MIKKIGQSQNFPPRRDSHPRWYEGDFLGSHMTHCMVFFYPPFIPTLSENSFSYPCYENDTQLILLFPSSDINVSVHIKPVWQIFCHGWQLITWNWILARLSCCVSLELHSHVKISLKNSWIAPPDNASNCAVVLDNQLSISPQIANLIHSCRFFFFTISEGSYHRGPSVAWLVTCHLGIGL